MAKKRMFSLSVIDTDLFLDLPASAQALYFHLGMRADDDGFLGNVKTIQRMVGASADDLKLLIAKGYLLTFQSGVCVIREWNVNNTLKKDRYQPTKYIAEKSALLKDASGAWYISAPTCNHVGTNPEPFRNQPGTNPEPQYRLDKGRLGKDRLGEGSDCAEPPKAPPAPPVPPVFQIPLNDNSLFAVTAEMVSHWRELYPAVDVEQELRKIIGWCEANPQKRKTKNGVNRFVTNWLSREQDRGGTRNGAYQGGYGGGRAQEGPYYARNTRMNPDGTWEYDPGDTSGSL